MSELSDAALTELYNLYKTNEEQRVLIEKLNHRLIIYKNCLDIIRDDKYAGSGGFKHLLGTVREYIHAALKETE